MEEADLPKAFAVDGVPADFNPSIPPSSGLEYLQHVMYETSKCPQLVVADMSKTKFKNVDDSGPNDNANANQCNLVSDSSPNDNANANQCNIVSDSAPSLEWQEHVISAFSELRQKVKRLRNFKNFHPIPLPWADDEDKWYDAMFGDNEARISPFLSTLLSMNEPLLGRILEHQVEWLEDGLKPEQGRWIYAILACIDLPLTPNVCSSLRDLARTCAKLRREKECPEDDERAAFDLFICLVKNYFGQIDLIL